MEEREEDDHYREVEPTAGEGSVGRKREVADAEVQVEVARKEAEVEVRPEMVDVGQVVGFNGDGSAAVPPGGFSIREVVTAVAQTPLDVPPYQVIMRLLERTGRVLDRGERATLHMLVVTSRLSRAALGQEIVWSLHQPPQPGEVEDPQTRLYARGRQMRELVEGVVHYGNWCSEGDATGLHKAPLADRGLGDELLEDLQRRACQADRAAVHCETLLADARRRLRDATQRHLEVEQAVRAITAATDRLLGQGVGGGPGAGWRGWAGGARGGPGGGGPVPDHPASPDVLLVSDEDV